MNSNDKLDHAKWLLERQLQWIAAAEVKIGFVITLDLAMLAALGAIIMDMEKISIEVGLLFLLTTAILFASILSAAESFKPNLSGPEKSLIFFGKIGCEAGDVFLDSYKQQTEADYLNDCLLQVHRNAQIATAKFQSVNLAIRWGVVVLPLWFVVIFIAAFNR